MIERADAVARQLDANAALLRADAVEVITADARHWLSGQPVQPYDIVFLDPPFALGMLADVCDTLQRRGWITAGSQIYLEADASVGFPALPAGWTLTRDKRAGGVRYGLAQVGRDDLGDDQVG
jgi:16S rRNA (guanine966-N2)-methyltransferase